MVVKGYALKPLFIGCGNMHDIEGVLNKHFGTKYKLTLEVNEKSFPIYFDSLEDKRLFIELMSDYYEDMEIE